MQTLAEKYLIKFLIESINKLGRKANIVNIGSNTSLVIENELDQAGLDFVEDRTDITNPLVEYAKLNKTFVCSVEKMDDVVSSNYDIAFANFVLEHVLDLDSSSKEINRILKKGGYFVTSIPNPEAPEFLLSKITPLWFHQWVRGSGEGHEAHETKYSYKNIEEFIGIFEKNGFKIKDKFFRPFTYGYLYRFPVLKSVSKIYDKIILRIGNERLMGNVCLVFEKK